MTVQVPTLRPSLLYHLAQPNTYLSYFHSALLVLFTKYFLLNVATSNLTLLMSTSSLFILKVSKALNNKIFCITETDVVSQKDTSSLRKSSC